MPESLDGSVTLWIDQLKSGDEVAAERLWERFFPALVAAANRKLGNAARRIADEEDVAVNVFQSLCAGAAAGKFSQLGDRHDLWKLMVAMAGNKAREQIRHQTAQKRGGVHLRGESALDQAEQVAGQGFDVFASDAPTPEFLAILEDQQKFLFNKLRNDVLRKIATLRIGGSSNAEIAAEVNITVRSVERKLRLIRDTWSDEVKPAEAPD